MEGNRPAFRTAAPPPPTCGDTGNSTTCAVTSLVSRLTKCTGTRSEPSMQALRRQVQREFEYGSVQFSDADTNEGPQPAKAQHRSCVHLCRHAREGRRAHQSTPLPWPALLTSSGARYSGVPHSVKVRARGPGLSRLAKPKSHNFKYPLGAISRFSGFKSLRGHCQHRYEIYTGKPGNRKYLA